MDDLLQQVQCKERLAQHGNGREVQVPATNFQQKIYSTRLQKVHLLHAAEWGGLGWGGGEGRRGWSDAAYIIHIHIHIYSLLGHF